MSGVRRGRPQRARQGARSPYEFVMQFNELRDLDEEDSCEQGE